MFVNPKKWVAFINSGDRLFVWENGNDGEEMINDVTYDIFSGDDLNV